MASSRLAIFAPILYHGVSSFSSIVDLLGEIVWAKHADT